MTQLEGHHFTTTDSITEIVKDRQKMLKSLGFGNQTFRGSQSIIPKTTYYLKREKLTFRMKLLVSLRWDKLPLYIPFNVIYWDSYTFPSSILVKIFKPNLIMKEKSENSDNN